jgi:hypothetical protein
MLNANMLRLLIPQRKAITAESELDRIAQRRPTQHFHLRVIAKAHLEQSTAQFRIAADANDVAAAAIAKLIQSAGLGIRALLARLKTTWLLHKFHSLTASNRSPL